MSTKNESVNPYRPDDLESGKWFYHEEVINKIKWVLEHARESRVVLLRAVRGSGKTGTLKKMTLSPELLGDEYIVVYLDSKNYSGRNIRQLIHVIYDSAAALIKEKYPRKEFPMLSHHQDNLEMLINQAFLCLDNALEGKLKLTLILDDFEKLLAAIGDNTLLLIFRLFKNISRPWKNYGLILAVDKKNENILSPDSFLSTMTEYFPIDVSETVDKQGMIRFITEPAAKFGIRFDDEALRDILYLSGGNFFLQQIICYYLFDFLTNKNLALCEKKHVDKTVDALLKDPRPEFVYAWNNIVPSDEARILVSALADDSITQKKASYFQIREKSLLDDVFSDNLSDELKKLQDTGYILPAIEKRFPNCECPFAIPLFGRWVRREHPFLKTVVGYIDVLTEKIELDSLLKAIQEPEPEKKLFIDKGGIDAIVKTWNRIKTQLFKENSPVDFKLTSKFFQIFFELILLQIKKAESKPGGDKSTEVEIGGLAVGRLKKLYCLLQDQPVLDETYVSSLERIISDLAQNDGHITLTIFFHFQKSKIVKELVSRTYLNVIALDETDLKKVLFSRDPREKFRNLVMSRLSLQKISPYHTSGPAKAIFYGRSEIINKIKGGAQTSFALLGARKIGKTSLLRKLKDETPPDAIYVYFNLELVFSNARNYEPFLKILTAELSEHLNRQIDVKKKWWQSGVDLLPELFREINAGSDKRLVLLFDEFDDCLAFDRKKRFKLMRAFRKISQNNYCQFVFAGFKEMYHQRRNLENPAYNFYEEIRLQPLDKNAAIDLATKPMKSIGVFYQLEDSPATLFNYTSGHPSLLQYFCVKLLERTERHEKAEERRTILVSDIEAVFNDDFEDFLIREVYMLDSDVEPLGRIIVFLMAESELARKKFTSTKILSILESRGLNLQTTQLDRQLRNLVMRFILKDEGKDHYSFCLNRFPEILKGWSDPIKIERLIKEIKKNDK